MALQTQLNQINDSYFENLFYSIYPFVFVSYLSHNCISNHTLPYVLITFSLPPCQPSPFPTYILNAPIIALSRMVCKLSKLKNPLLSNKFSNLFVIEEISSKKGGGVVP